MTWTHKDVRDVIVAGHSGYQRLADIINELQKRLDDSKKPVIVVESASLGPR